MHKTVIRVLCLALVAVLCFGLFSACSAKRGDEILIGVLCPTTGDEAYYGQDMLNSYQLAVDEINAKGGVLGRKLKLFQADDEAKADKATQAATQIISQNVDFVVGGYASGATVPTLPLFDDAGLLMLVSCANSTRITDAGHTQTFMLNSPGSHAAVTLTDLCKSLGTQKVALIHQADDYSQNLADLCRTALAPAGIALAADQVMNRGEADASAVVTAIIQSGADFVYWCGYHADGSKVIKQLRSGGYQGVICVGDGSASPELITACGAAGEGVYVTSPPFVKFAEGGAEFEAAYTQKFNKGPGNYATLAYDTIYVLAEAIEKAGTTDTAAVRDAIAAIDYKGLSGRIKFTANRELEFSNFIVLKIKDGEFVLADD